MDSTQEAVAIIEPDAKVLSAEEYSAAMHLRLLSVVPADIENILSKIKENLEG